MASLKSKAKKSSGGSLAAKAQAKGTIGGSMAPPPEDPALHNTLPTIPGTFNTAPPPPPALQYLRFFSSIPSLRKASNGMGVN